MKVGITTILHPDKVGLKSQSCHTLHSIIPRIRQHIEILLRILDGRITQIHSGEGFGAKWWWEFKPATRIRVICLSCLTTLSEIHIDQSCV